MLFNSLPHELVEYMFTMVDPKLDSNPLPEVCKGWNGSQETLLERIWQKLKDLSIQEGCPSLKNRMEEIELPGTDRYITLFKKLFQTCHAFHDNPPVLSETIHFFLERQKAADRHLINFWNKASCYPRDFQKITLPPLQDAEEIRAWLENTDNKDFLGQMDVLEITSAKLEELPPEIEHFINLRTIYLNYNDLISLPSEIGNLRNLENLELCENKLIDLNPEIVHLIKLRKLHLGYNCLKKLPSQIGALTELVKLICCSNKLITVPKELGCLTMLKKLYLGDNELVELPSELGNLTHLEGFELENNNLIVASLPQEILALNPTGLEAQRGQQEA